jgi:hypothetical protein
MSTIIITPRLLGGLRVADAYISLDPLSHKPGYWAWYIDLPDGSEHSGDDLRAPGSIGGALESLLGFLGACGESLRYGGDPTDPDSNASLFPRPVAEWAAANYDELGMLEFELQEANECDAS